MWVTDSRRLRSAREPDSGPGHQLNDPTMALHFHSGGIAWVHADDHALSADPQVQVQTPVVDRECQHTKRFRPMRRQDDAVGPGLHPGEAALHQVDTAGHGREVYTF